MRRFLLVCLLPLLVGCTRPEVGPEIVLIGPANDERGELRTGAEERRSPFTETGAYRPGGANRHVVIAEPGIHRVTWRVRQMGSKACDARLFIAAEGGSASSGLILIGNTTSLDSGHERGGEARTPPLSPGPHTITVRSDCSDWMVRLRPD